MVNRVFLGVTALLSFLILLVSYRFLLLPLAEAFPEHVPHLDQRQIMFLVHVSASPVALLIGSFQFMPRIRAKRPALHRWLGRVYGVAILLGGVSGLAISLNAVGGPMAAVGFSLLAVLWLGTTARAVQLAMQRRITQHRIWMIRSFALTLAALTLRLQLPFFLGSGMPYESASIWVAWLCWVPNLIVAEWIIRRKA